MIDISEMDDRDWYVIKYKPRKGEGVLETRVKAYSNEDARRRAMKEISRRIMSVTLVIGE